MYKTNSSLHPVPADTPISRYMDFVSFYSLLRNQTLFFKRLDQYTDQLEGLIFDETIEEYKGNILVRDPAMKLDKLQEMAAKHFQTIKGHRDRTLSNSWNIGNDENYAMWKIYLRGSTEGVAVRTTVGKMIDQLTKITDMEFCSGKVYYEMIHDNDTNQFRVSTTKRKAYQYENEYRFLVLHQFEYGQLNVPKWAVGAPVKLDVAELIDEIYISPFASAWFNTVVKELISDILPSFDTRKIINSTIQDI